MAGSRETELGSLKWEYFELWEKVEARLKRRRRIWIASAVGVFIAISLVPVYLHQAPRWATQRVSRLLALEISHLKTEASLIQRARTLRLETDLKVSIWDSVSCGGPLTRLKEENFADRSPSQHALTLLSPEQAKSLSVPGLVSEVCYDPLRGSVVSADPAGLGVIPVSDLTEGRVDRLSVVILRGLSAEISFD